MYIDLLFITQSIVLQNNSEKKIKKTKKNLIKSSEKLSVVCTNIFLSTFNDLPRIP